MNDEKQNQERERRCASLPHCAAVWRIRLVGFTAMFPLQISHYNDLVVN